MPRPIKSGTSDSEVESTLKATALLAEKKAKVKEDSERLNTCIERFEAWVAKLPGRVEVYVDLPDPNPRPENEAHGVEACYKIKLSREGKEWHLTGGYWIIGDDAPIRWTRLREVSLDLKLYVIPRLHLLVLEMAKEQERLNDRIQEVADGFEDFATKVGIPEEGT